MKVLFISQPNEHRQKPDFPLIGLAYLSSYLKKAGIRTSVIEAYPNIAMEAVSSGAISIAAGFTASQMQRYSDRLQSLVGTEGKDVPVIWVGKLNPEEMAGSY